MNKCYGCGILTEENLCERCFRIRNYNDYQVINKTNDEYEDILKRIGKTKELVVLVVDLFNIEEAKNICQYLNNDILLVLTKRDIFPKSVYEEKLLQYNYGIDCIDKIIISSKKNYNFDDLFDKINNYKKSKIVYVVGLTNAGKSSMINKIIYNYSTKETSITTSPIASTTLNEIEIEINPELTLIDTPGILLEKDLTTNVTAKKLKKIVPNAEIKPITFQVKGKQYIIIDEFAIVEVTNMDITIYMSRILKITRKYKEIMLPSYCNEINVKNEDIVIRGLGFINCRGNGIVKIYTNAEICSYKRQKLI